MGEITKIQWTHHTFNPWIGCAKVSPACDHCYAEAGSRRLGAQHGLQLWNGDRFFTGDEYWKQPARWNRAADKAGERHRVFSGSMCDFFEDREDLVGRRERLGRVILATPMLDWLPLTKRPENIWRLMPECWGGRVPSNVWLGTTVEDQKHADLRLPHLLGVEARVHFVSYEPALGPVDFAPWLRAGLDWVITGGESGPHSRPFNVTWAREAIRQCREAGKAPFFKQMGARPYEGSNRALEDGGGGIGIALKDKKGGDPAEWPADLRVREFPTRAAA